MKKKTVRLLCCVLLLALLPASLNACSGNLGCAAANALNSGEFYANLIYGDEYDPQEIEIAEKDGVAVILTDGERIVLAADSSAYVVWDDAGEYAVYNDEDINYENVYVKPGRVKVHNTFTAGDGKLLYRNYDLGNKRLYFVYIKDKLSRIRYEKYAEDGKTVIDEEVFDVVKFKSAVPSSVSFDIPEDYKQIS